jgi:hypothetical protein
MSTRLSLPRRAARIRPSTRSATRAIGVTARAIIATITAVSTLRTSEHDVVAPSSSLDRCPHSGRGSALSVGRNLCQTHGLRWSANSSEAFFFLVCANLCDIDGLCPRRDRLDALPLEVAVRQRGLAFLPRRPAVGNAVQGRRRRRAQRACPGRCCGAWQSRSRITSPSSGPGSR